MTDGRDGYELAPAWLSSKNLQSVSTHFMQELFRRKNACWVRGFLFNIFISFYLAKLQYLIVKLFLDQQLF